MPVAFTVAGNGSPSGTITVTASTGEACTGPPDGCRKYANFSSIQTRHVAQQRHTVKACNRNNSFAWSSCNRSIHYFKNLDIWDAVGAPFKRPLCSI